MQHPLSLHTLSHLHTSSLAFTHPLPPSHPLSTCAPHPLPISTPHLPPSHLVFCLHTPLPPTHPSSTSFTPPLHTSPPAFIPPICLHTPLQPSHLPFSLHSHLLIMALLARSPPRALALRSPSSLAPLLHALRSRVTVRAVGRDLVLPGGLRMMAAAPHWR